MSSSIKHPFKEGERVHFAHQVDLEAGLRYGYLEQYTIGDQGILNRVICYQPESETYVWYEAPMGVAPSAMKKRTYGTLDELLEEVDVHAYLWYPLFPKGYALQHMARSSYMPGASYDYINFVDRLYPQYQEKGRGEH